MLSPRLRDQLTSQLEELREQNREILQDIVALSEILGLDAAETPPVDLARPSRRNGKITFVSHIRNALASIGEPAKAKQVASVLEFKGIKIKSKVTLATYVACELARMHDRPSSNVRRVSTGLYVLEADGGGNGNGAG